MKLRKIIAKFLLLCMLITVMPITAMAENGTNVAKVGSKEYATIDEAVANWTNGSMLTLLADVTLSDVITLKSTEHHILNLDTYTLTAADGKNVFEIMACGTGNAERSALTIKADAEEPGGIDAGKKSVVYYDYSKGGISVNDRPIIKIEGGVFTGSTSSFGSAGIYTKGTAARKCATINISGGTFNCSIIGQSKSKMLISGGTFNYAVGSQGDSTCYRQISGGKFKSFGFMTADASNKFWVGTSASTFNVGLYVDDDGYLIVGGDVITEPGTKFEASASPNGWSSSLKHSSAAENELFYTSFEEALADNNKTSGKVTVYLDELDLTDINYKGTIIYKDTTLSVGDEVTVIFDEGTEPEWTVDGKVEDGYGLFFRDTEANGKVMRTYYVAPAKTVSFNTDGGSDIEEQKIEVNTIAKEPEDDPEKNGFVFGGWYTKDIEGNLSAEAYDFDTPVTEDVELFAKWIPLYTVTFDSDVDAQDVKEGECAEEPEDDPEKEGYVFGGWYTKDTEGNLSAEAYDFDTPVTEDVELFAKWIPLYTVTFDSDVDAQDVVEGECAEEPEDEPEKEGYTFSGWYTKDNEGNLSAEAFSFTTPITEDTELFAKWTANTYKVQFDANGGSGNIEDQSFTYDTEQALTANTFVYANKYFNGWKNDEGTDFTDKQTVKNLTAENNGVVTMYAQWADKPAQAIDFDTSDRFTKSNYIKLNARKATAEGAITYSSSDESVATVDENGAIRIIKAGEVIITATAAETEDYAETSASYKLIIEQSEEEQETGSSSRESLYSVSINKDNIENGSVKTNRLAVKKGTTVTLTVTPDEGYELDKLDVMDEAGKKVELKDKDNGKFTFSMPGKDVVVEASFKKTGGFTADEYEETNKTLILTIGQVAYQLDGKYFINDVAPVIKENRTMLPVRLVAEFLGADVTWNGTEKSVTIVKNNVTVVIYIDQAFAMVNGVPVQLDAPAFIENSRTYLPLRFVAENLGAEVSWNGDTKEITISY